MDAADVSVAAAVGTADATATAKAKAAVGATDAPDGDAATAAAAAVETVLRRTAAVFGAAYIAAVPYDIADSEEASRHRLVLSAKAESDYGRARELPGALAARPDPLASRSSGGGGYDVTESALLERTRLVSDTAASAPAAPLSMLPPPPPPSSSALALQTRGTLGAAGPAVPPSDGTSRALLRREDYQPIRPQWHAPWKLMKVISGHLGWVRSVAVEPGNQWFCTGAGDRLIKIWDLASGTLKLSLTGHISTVRGLAVSARHPYLFSCGEDKLVKCWDLETNKVIRHYHGHLSGVYCLDLHPTVDVLVTAGRDAVARVWDMRTRQEVHTLVGHTATVAALKCQEAEPQVLTGSMDSTVRLWDLVAGKTRGVLTHHKKSVRALVLHPNEYTFASASADNIKQWKCPEGAFIQNFEGHNAIIDTLSVNADDVLFSGGDNGSMVFWDWRSGHRYQTVETTVQPGSLESEAGIFASTFDQTGLRLITCEADKSVRIYGQDETATEESHPLDWQPTLARRKY